MAAPITTNIPGYAQYGTAGLLAKTAYDNTLARINRTRQQSMHQYGYLGDVNPDNGTIQNLRVDPNNQFGDFQSMLRNQAGADQQAEFATQDRGLHGGMANKATSALKYQHGAESAQFGKNFANQFTDYADQQQQATYDRDRALYEAQLLATQNAIANGAFNTANFGGADTGGSGLPAPTLAGSGSSSKAAAARAALIRRLKRPSSATRYAI